MPSVQFARSLNVLGSRKNDGRHQTKAVAPPRLPFQISAMDRLRFSLEQFQEKCIAVFRPELRKNKHFGHFRVSVGNGNALVKENKHLEHFRVSVENGNALVKNEKRPGEPDLLQKSSRWPLPVHPWSTARNDLSQIACRLSAELLPVLRSAISS